MNIINIDRIENKKMIFFLFNVIIFILKKLNSQLIKLNSNILLHSFKKYIGNQQQKKLNVEYLIILN